MQYLLDTVALVRHFASTGYLGREAARILDTVEESENILVISVISLMEVMYLAEKHRIQINLAETLDMVASSSRYMIVDLSPDILRVAAAIDFHELHDRLILATAKWLGIKVISSDAAFSEVEGIEVVWD